MKAGFWGVCADGRLELHVHEPATAVTFGSRELTAAVAGLIVPPAELAPGQHPANGGSAALLLEAYLKWGEGFAGHLVGQFCGMVFDRRQRQLFLVQDSFGIRPIFYSSRTNPERFCFSTKLSALPLQATPQLDLEYLADYLAQAECCTEKTPFKGVSRLVAGTTLRSRGRKLFLFRPWGPLDAADAGWDGEAVRESRLRELLEDSLSPLQHAPGPIWCDVSGGLDSTTVFAVAKKKGLAVEPFSVVSKHELDGGDTEVLQAVFSQSSSPWHFIDASDYPPFAVLPDVPGDEPGGEIGFALRRAVSQLRTQQRITHLLSGMGGDQVFGSRDYLPAYLADDLCRFRPLSLYRGLRDWADHYSESRSLLFWFVHYAIAPLLAHARQRRIAHTAGMPNRPRWIRRDFIRKYDLFGSRLRLALPRHPQPGRNMLWQEVYLISAMEGATRSYAFAHDYYYPLLHRPLVEFMFSLPHQERRKSDCDRALQRRALKGVLPPAVLERRDKGTGQMVFDRSFQNARAWHAALKTTPRLVELGVFEAKEWAQAVDRARFGQYDSLPHFCASVGIELWLRCQPSL